MPCLVAWLLVSTQVGGMVMTATVWKPFVCRVELASVGMLRELDYDVLVSMNCLACNLIYRHLAFSDASRKEI